MVGLRGGFAALLAASTEPPSLHPHAVTVTVSVTLVGGLLPGSRSSIRSSGGSVVGSLSCVGG